jgi:hypothetical protein
MRYSISSLWDSPYGARVHVVRDGLTALDVYTMLELRQYGSADNPHSLVGERVLTVNDDAGRDVDLNDLRLDAIGQVLDRGLPQLHIQELIDDPRRQHARWVNVVAAPPSPGTADTEGIVGEWGLATTYLSNHGGRIQVQRAGCTALDVLDVISFGPGPLGHTEFLHGTERLVAVQTTSGRERELSDVVQAAFVDSQDRPDQRAHWNNHLSGWVMNDVGAGPAGLAGHDGRAPSAEDWRATAWRWLDLTGQRPEPDFLTALQDLLRTDPADPAAAFADAVAEVAAARGLNTTPAKHPTTSPRALRLPGERGAWITSIRHGPPPPGRSR